MVVSEQTRILGAQRFAVDPHSMKDMGGTDGAVYSCRKDNRAFVMKFLPMREEEIPRYEEKLKFVHYLSENGVPIAVPVESPSGQLYERVQEGEQIYLVLLTPLASGRHPQARNLYDWNERLFHTWGQVMGKMHALARQYPTWEKPDESSAGHPVTHICDWREEHQSFAVWCKEPKIVSKWNLLYEPLSCLPRDRSNYGLIHNDLHQWNFFYQPDARGVHPITIIDFDVCSYHWFLTDISIAVYHAMTEGRARTLEERRSFARNFLTHFMQGYREENLLDEGWFVHLPLFLKYREILLYIALSNTWPKEHLNPWQKRFLADKRGRTLRDEAII